MQIEASFRILASALNLNLSSITCHPSFLEIDVRRVAKETIFSCTSSWQAAKVRKKEVLISGEQKVKGDHEGSFFYVFIIISRIISDSTINLSE